MNTHAGSSPEKPDLAKLRETLNDAHERACRRMEVRPKFFKDVFMPPTDYDEFTCPNCGKEMRFPPDTHRTGKCTCGGEGPVITPKLKFMNTVGNSWPIISGALAELEHLRRKTTALEGEIKELRIGAAR